MELLSITLSLGLRLRTWCSTQAFLLALDRLAMLSKEDKIRLIHKCRSALLDRMFDELCCKSPGSNRERVSDEIVAAAKRIQKALSDSVEIPNPTRGLFVLALQQVVDSFIAGLLTEEAFEWLAEEQRRMDQLLLEEIDLGRRQ